MTATTVHTTTMKALQLLGPRKTVMAEIPKPVTPDDGLLMKTRCVSICSTDISMFEGNLFPSEYPVILGHEYLGEVVDIGPGFVPPADGLEVGDRVVYWGQTDFGGFAEYRTVRPIFAGQVKEDVFWADRNFHDDRRAAAVKVPPELADTHASFIEPATGALRAILTHPPQIGDRVLVLGTGPIGVIAGSIIKRLFAPHSVASVDSSPDRNDFARRQFSDASYLPDRFVSDVEENTFDYVFDALPPIKGDEERDPRRMAMRRLKPRGKYVLYGASQEMQKFDTWLMLAKGITVGSAPFDVTSFPMYKSAGVIAAAMHMLTSGVIDAPALLSRVIPFGDHDRLVSVLENYRGTTDMKTVIDFRD
ncbi:zinc-dependent alcohol dehydrogenase [Nocardiopsis suaedae]|uniref:Alcohol dehydrogenase catalytic domain-containing protein n=1 Tax=Nocardiopsis suaedae TaxID=3018444 RepID=A0ABT4TSH3_9ACTN|nr:alcohol dehydrogenase catalytic domain-containing protein [Nocardiopsis suaedae]MDA2807640.1 alcohol dehydrogenase catalytic domain-containing protein [Nocardiopsis suaedae]